MLERIGGNRYDPGRMPKSKRFDEGKHIDTGEIDPITGERIFVNPDSLIKKEVKKAPLKIEKRRIPFGVCEHCKQDPCKVDCVYR